MLAAEVITSVVTRGLSLRISVPGEIFVTAMRAFPFPGRESTFQSCCSEDEVLLVTGPPFSVLREEEVVEGEYWRSETSGAMVC